MIPCHEFRVFLTVTNLNSSYLSYFLKPGLTVTESGFKFRFFVIMNKEIIREKEA